MSSSAVSNGQLSRRIERNRSDALPLSGSAMLDLQALLTVANREARVSHERAAAAVGEHEIAIHDIGDKSARRVADGKDDAFVADLVVERALDLVISICDQPADDARLRRFRIRVERVRRGQFLALVRIDGERAHDRSVVERVGVVRGRISFVFGDHRLQHVAMRLGEIVAFGRIGFEIEQQPVVQIDLLAGRLKRSDLPLAADIAAIALEFVILIAATRRRIGGGQRVLEADAVEAARAIALELFWIVHAEKVEQRRQDVADMHPLATERAGILQALRPLHDQRHANAAVHRRALVEAERRIAGIGPSHGIGRIGIDAAERPFREHAFRRVGVLEHGDALFRDIRRAVRSADRVGAVVGRDDDQRVVEYPEIFEFRDESPDILVGIVDERGVELHVGGHDRPRVFGHVRPRNDARRIIRQLPVRTDDASLALARETLPAQLFPSLVVAALVSGEVLGLGVQRHVRRVRGEVHVERFRRTGRAMRAQHRDRLVGPVVRGEIVFPVRVDRQELVAFDELGRREVIRLGAEETIETVEPTLQRPRCAIGGGVSLVIGRVVPFADCVGRITCRAQQFRYCRRILRYLAGLKAGKSGIGVRKPAASDGMRIFAGHHRRARRGAHRHGRVIGEAQSALREPVDVRRCDFAAEHPKSEKPRSSSRMTRMFGAPAGGFTGGRHQGFDSWNVRPILPWKPSAGSPESRRICR